MLFIMLCYYVVILISYYSPLFGTSETTPGVLHLGGSKKQGGNLGPGSPCLRDILERVWGRAARLVRDLENKSYA